MKVKRNYALAIQPLAQGLKCDRPGCGYINAGVTLTVKTIPSLVGTPCPQCGASLLTKEDARLLVFILRLCAVFNFVCFPLILFYQLLHLLHLK